MDLPITGWESMPFAASLQKIEAKLDELLLIGEVPYKSLIEAARYSTLSKAGRIRPLIVFEMATSYGAREEEALLPACALELVHTYTLIHDDLPCMDDEVERRGKLPLHKVVDEGLALLTGDYLLTYAFELLSKHAFISAEKRLEMIQILSSLGGAEGLIGGQVLDLFSPKTSIEEILWINARKTGDLFLACFEFAAILADVSPQDRALFAQFGSLFGLIYQILDDADDNEKQSIPINSLLEELDNLQSPKAPIQKSLVEQLKKRAACWSPRPSLN